MTFVIAVWNVLLALAPWLLVGAATAGLIHVLVPPNFIRRALGGRFGVLRAVLIGVPLPLCSCGVIPTALSLRKQGASRGASIGFLIATPQTGVDSVLVSASMLGWPFALFKVVTALTLGMVGGHAAGAVSKDSDVQAPPKSATEERRRAADGVSHAVEILRTIWRWLAFGVLVSAGISVLLPANTFHGLGGWGSALAMGAALGVSLPLYVCATASVPIAAALVASGFPEGAALVFLIAGPATNLATVGAVRRAFGTSSLVAYLLTVALGSVIFGWAFDSVLAGAPSLHHGMHNHQPAGAWWAVASACACIALVAWFAFDDLRTWVRRRNAGPPTIAVEVDGLTCEGCVRKVTTVIRGLEGACEVQVQRTPRGLVTAAGVTEDEVREAIRRAGYRPA